MAEGSGVPDPFFLDQMQGWGWGAGFGWMPYPPDVPITSRKKCESAGCDAAGAVVHASSDRSFGWRVTVYCEPHAEEDGYKPESLEVPPAHLNGFQRWLVKLLGH